ncbi:hypothetical protein [Mycobacteroides salmoniphilum]|uniref:hypothetical protein n=1 Tax=Mycobacteroides salmoniphilum TaxID=404941 RepID=UPI0010AA05E3|nr:hypothetical protein [Mycobacteroides salmoniphilum]
MVFLLGVTEAIHRYSSLATFSMRAALDAVYTLEQRIIALETPLTAAARCRTQALTMNPTKGTDVPDFGDQ